MTAATPQRWVGGYFFFCFFIPYEVSAFRWLVATGYSSALSLFTAVTCRCPYRTVSPNLQKRLFTCVQSSRGRRRIAAFVCNNRVLAMLRERKGKKVEFAQPGKAKSRKKRTRTVSDASTATTASNALSSWSVATQSSKKPRKSRYDPEEESR